MSDGYRNGAFALGLVAGGGLVLNLLLWSAYLANEESDAPTQPDENPQSHPIVTYWDWLVGTFIAPSDSVAQWAMALLSLAAVVLLWWTLKASRQTLNSTRQMARDTREIGEAQVRAYLSIEKITYFIDERRHLGVSVAAKNFGQSPATKAQAVVKVNGFTRLPEGATLDRGIHKDVIVVDFGEIAAGDTCQSDSMVWMNSIVQEAFLREDYEPMWLFQICVFGLDVFGKEVSAHATFTDRGHTITSRHRVLDRGNRAKVVESLDGLFPDLRCHWRYRQMAKPRD